VLNYVLSGPRAGVGALSVNAVSGALTATFPSNQSTNGLPWLEGTYDTATDDYVLNSSLDPVAWVDTTGVPFGALEVRVTQTFRWNDGNDPTSGELTVTSRDVTPTFEGTVKVAVTSTPASGVNISWDSDDNGVPDAGPVFYSWIDFDELWENAGIDLWQRVASFTYSMREFLYDQAELAIEAFTVIEDLFSSFEMAGPGSTLPATCSPNPPVHTWPNEVRVTWNDHDGSATININDSFTFVFDNCWIDDPTNDIDEVLNGRLDFLYYDRHVQACPSYSALRLDETNAGGVIANSDITLNGGLCLFIPGI
jgi:hypothetical protein